MALLEFTSKGIFCPQAEVYIDPSQPVKRALITHGHADHSRPGHQHYLCTRLAKPVIRYRLGPIKIETLEYGESINIHGVHFSFHPAGHIIGSAQIRVEYKGEVWVVSGDYKIEDDGLSTPFQAVKCHTFITESTFGLPIFKWRPQVEIFKKINDWWRKNREAGKVSVLSAYPLGKAQRLLQGVDLSIGTVYAYGAIENINRIIRKQGIQLASSTRITQHTKRKSFTGNLVITPPGVVGTTWMKRFKDVSTGIASGWVAQEDDHRHRTFDQGFVLSDHADWDGLNQAVKATGAERVYVTHGYTEAFRKWLEEQGLEAGIV